MTVRSRSRRTSNMSRRISNMSSKNSDVTRKNSLEHKPYLKLDNSHHLRIQEYHKKNCKANKKYSCIKINEGNNLYTLRIEDGQISKETLIEAYADAAKTFIILRNRIKYCWYDKCRKDRYAMFYNYLVKMFNRFIKINGHLGNIDLDMKDLIAIKLIKKNNSVDEYNFWNWTFKGDNEDDNKVNWDSFRIPIAILQIDFLIFVITDMMSILKNRKRLHSIRTTNSLV